MSHYTVLVRLSVERLNRHDGNAEEALAEMLAPYEESPEEGSEFLVFEDRTEEWRTEYEEGTTEHVFRPDGTHDYPWNVKDVDEKNLPAGYSVKEVPYKEIYGSFAKFCKDYHGAKSEGKKWGHYHNPNAKWDWWIIGGRWSGFFPLKSDRKPVLGRSGAFDNKPNEGCGDVVRIGDIDFDECMRRARASAEEFFENYTLMLEIGEKGLDARKMTFGPVMGSAPAPFRSV